VEVSQPISESEACRINSLNLDLTILLVFLVSKWTSDDTWDCLLLTLDNMLGCCQFQGSVLSLHCFGHPAPFTWEFWPLASGLVSWQGWASLSNMQRSVHTTIRMANPGHIVEKKRERTRWPGRRSLRKMQVFRDIAAKPVDSVFLCWFFGWSNINLVKRTFKYSWIWRPSALDNYRYICVYECRLMKSRFFTIGTGYLQSSSE